MKLNLPVLIETGASPHGCSRAVSFVRCPVFAARRYVPASAVHLPTEEESVPLIARRPPAHYLLRGTLLHAGLAHYYYARKEKISFKEAVPYALRAVGTAAGQLEAQWSGCVTGEKSSPQGPVLPLVLRALRCYFGVYLMEDIFSHEVLTVEETFTETVTDPVTKRQFPFTQKMDLTFRSRADRLVYYVDHKGTTKLSSASARRYTLTLQFLGMQYFGRLRHGDEFGGAWVNLVGFDPFGFVRCPPEPAPYRLANWPKDYCNMKLLEENYRARYGDDPENYPGAVNEQTCQTNYGLCPDTDICQYGPAVVAARAVPEDLTIEIEDF